MKVTLWQQFSSNHSNSFNVVGVFESIKDASNAQVRLKKLIGDITKWRDDNPSQFAITEPERKIAEEFNINWDEKYYFLDDGQRLEIDLFDNIIEVGAPADSWIRKIPVEILLQKYGATAVAGWDALALEYQDGEISVFNMTAKGTAPDIETLKRIHDYCLNRVSIEDEKIKVNGLTIKFLEDYFDMSKLQLIVNKLREESCTDVEYHLTKEKID
jgi:hypothetical protein